VRNWHLAKQQSYVATQHPAKFVARSRVLTDFDQCVVLTIY